MIIFGKPKSTGINITTEDNNIVGTGVRMNNSETVVLTGLEYNNDYRFAFQTVDRYGNRVCYLTLSLGVPLEKLSTPSADVSTYFPLPIVMCLSYLAQTAFANECYDIAKKAANTILKPYVQFSSYSVCLAL